MPDKPQTAPAAGAPTAASDQLAQMCGAGSRDIAGLPIDQFQQAIQPTDEQRAALDDLVNQAADLLNASCLTDDPLTPPARLTAVGKRLNTMLQAVKVVSSALNDFYGTLSDEQKARFEAIGPQRTTQFESLEVTHTNVRRRGPPALNKSFGV